jgi:SNF2 family DNA or RNA helicase
MIVLIVCNHPFLFSPDGYNLDDVIIRSSGKLALLDQMLPKLKAAGHRILLFTQMTQVMTILEDYFAFRGYLSLRLDGSTSAEEREKRMYRFNSPDSPYFIFLLSTRAGGLGLNLTAVSTIVVCCLFRILSPDFLIPLNRLSLQSRLIRSSYLIATGIQCRSVSHVEEEFTSKNVSSC